MDINKIRKFNRDLTVYLGVYDTNLFNLQYSMLALRTISEIDKKETIIANDLVKIFQVDKGYLSRTIKKLEKDGMIIRTQDKKDRRSWNLSTTKEGHKIANIINEKSDERVQRLLDNISAAEQDNIAHSIELLQNSLDKINQAKES